MQEHRVLCFVDPDHLEYAYYESGLLDHPICEELSLVRLHNLQAPDGLLSCLEDVQEPSFDEAYGFHG